MKVITEAQMADTFESKLKGEHQPLTFLPTSTSYRKEVHCLQGRPDFVLMPTDQKRLSAENESTLARALGAPSLAHILSLLKRKAARTEDYLARTSGLSLAVVRRALGTLRELELVRPVSASSYTLSPSCPPLDDEMWAFELKLDHWRRALFQACQYKAFAHAVVVVMSEYGLRRAEKYVDRFRALNIGLMSLDVETAQLRVIVRPMKQPPASRRHYLYALGSFLAGQQQYEAPLHD